MRNGKIALCMGVRGADKILREYVEYYISQGVDKFLIYNNYVEGSPAGVLQGLEDYVEIVKGNNKQLSCFTDGYARLQADYEWIMFFDDDEFLFVNKDSNIKEYLSRDMFKDVDCIHVNWKMYGDNGLLHPIEVKSIFEMNPEPCPLDLRRGYDFPENNHVKTIVHCTGLRIVFRHPHFCLSNDRALKAVNASGVPVPNNSPFAPYDFEYAELRHYQYRTTEDFCFKRLHGRSDVMFDGVPYIIQREIENYFKLCGRTPEKEAIIDEYLRSHGWTHKWGKWWKA